jgi:hypothetical protein
MKPLNQLLLVPLGIKLEKLHFHLQVRLPKVHILENGEVTISNPWGVTGVSRDPISHSAWWYRVQGPGDSKDVQASDRSHGRWEINPDLPPQIDARSLCEV